MTISVTDREIIDQLLADRQRHSSGTVSAAGSVLTDFGSLRSWLGHRKARGPEQVSYRFNSRGRLVGVSRRWLARWILRGTGVRSMLQGWRHL